MGGYVVERLHLEVNKYLAFLQLLQVLAMVWGKNMRCRYGFRYCLLRRHVRGTPPFPVHATPLKLISLKYQIIFEVKIELPDTTDGVASTMGLDRS